MQELIKEQIQQQVSERAGKEVKVYTALLDYKGSLVVVFSYNERIFIMEAKDMNNDPQTYEEITISILETIKLDDAGDTTLVDGVYVL